MTVTMRAAAAAACLSLLAFAAGGAAAQDGAKPRAVLACGDQALSSALVGGEDDVIEAEGPVTALDDQAVPPYLVLCDGAPRLACVMETPLAGAAVGARVHVLGRVTEGDERMLVIDPCGATTAK